MKKPTNIFMAMLLLAGLVGYNADASKEAVIKENVAEQKQATEEEK